MFIEKQHLNGSFPKIFCELYQGGKKPHKQPENEPLPGGKKKKNFHERNFLRFKRFLKKHF